jgi:AraC family transcriptional regulator
MSILDIVALHQTREIMLRWFDVTRSFRAFTGMTIGEFTRAQRLERARLLLTDPSLSLAQIAQLAGFSDQSHLTRLFRRCLNVTPKQLRDGSSSNE